MDLFDIAVASKLAGGGGGGGGGGLDLLAEQSLGTIATSSTSSADTGKKVTVKGIYAYDILICMALADNTGNGNHIGTVSIVLLTGNNTTPIKNDYLIDSPWNAKFSSTETATTKTDTTRYGVYPYTCSISAGDTGDNGQVEITIYKRYNSSQTGTINSPYTMRVYGIKLFDFIDG